MAGKREKEILEELVAVSITRTRLLNWKRLQYENLSRKIAKADAHNSELMEREKKLVAQLNRKP